METSTISHYSLITFIFLAFISFSEPAAHYSDSHQCFLRCLQNHSEIASNIVYYTPNNSSSYLSILNSSIRNLRFTSPSTPKPLVIVTPMLESQIPAIVLCANETGLQVRTRSGGHDYEGLSYTSQVPFVVIDLINLTEITIQADQKTAWVQSGATLGQLYYKISQKNTTLAFPAGTCPTIGIGGHLSGGGYGTLIRKYGLAADNILDASLVDVDGRILNRTAMGEDLFWAIRGGGGASFAVITAWKLNLVLVPENLTVFSISRTLAQNATGLVYKWQHIAPTLPKDIFISLSIDNVNSGISATFTSLFLGGVDGLLKLLKQKFPELGVERDDCNQVSWVQSALFFSGYSIKASPQVLASRIPSTRENFKAKSDYVQKLIPEDGFRGIWKLFQEKEVDTPQMIFTPYGGRMEEVPESAVPFPHRAGNLYKIQYLVYWDEPGRNASRKNIDWIMGLYSYMTPYVSKSPRAAYINYRDLDLGTNNAGNNTTSCAQARIWGVKYFKNNFDKLVQIKTKIDPSNFFRNEQSIPPSHFQ